MDTPMELRKWLNAFKPQYRMLKREHENVWMHLLIVKDNTIKGLDAPLLDIPLLVKVIK
jgi:hypothetical protein